MLDQPFDPKLKDRTSQEFLDMQMKLTTPFKDLYCDPFGPCCDTTVSGFRQGSVIAGFLVAIASGELTSCDIAAKLTTQMGSLPATIGGISVTPGSLAASKSVIFLFLVVMIRRKYSDLEKQFGLLVPFA